MVVKVVFILEEEREVQVSENAVSKENIWTQELSDDIMENSVIYTGHFVLLG
jgi:hypothetical protein